MTNQPMRGRQARAIPRLPHRSAMKRSPFVPLVLPLVFVVPLVFVLVGCDEAGMAGTGSFEVTDSAGIRIATNPETGARDGNDGWEVREVFRVGTIDGPEETLFDRPGQMVPDGDGGVFVVEAGESAIRRYAADGTFHGRIGRSGDGPGEFRSPGALARQGDTLVVFDPRLMRMSFFLGDGEFLENRPVRLDFSTHGVPGTLAPIGGREFLAVAGAGCSLPAPDDRRPRARVSIARQSEGGGNPVEFTGPVTTWIQSSTTPVYGATFCTAMPALAGHSFPRAFRDDGLVAVAPGPAYEIHLFRVPADAVEPDAWRGGAFDVIPPPELIIRRAIAPRPVGIGDRRLFEERMLPEEENIPGMRDAIRAAWDTMSIPESYPQIQALLWDDDGNLWVHRQGPWDPDAPSRNRWPAPWDVFNPEGRYLGEISFPVDFTVAMIHRKWAWGIARGEYDVAQLVAYEIIP